MEWEAFAFDNRNAIHSHSRQGTGLVLIPILKTMCVCIGHTLAFGIPTTIEYYSEFSTNTTLILMRVDNHLHS
jgi:hypothetical protein